MRQFIAALALLFAPSLFAHGQDMWITADDNGDVTSCSQIHVTFDHQPAVTAEEELPVANLRSLKLSTDKGSIRVNGWDQPRYGVTVCKAAASASTLAAVRARLNGNEVSGSGPDSENQWVIQYLVHTPRNATLDIDTHNGPVSLHHVNGTLALHAQNGPIALKDASGTIDATTVNGPISLAGGSGNVKLAAMNGPVSVKLTGSRWDGTLDATTQNGPVSLKIPKNFGSGVEMTVNGRGPISCKAEACRDVKRSWHDDDNDYPRKLSFGSGAKNVTLSTTNGPVSVKESD